MIEQIVETYAFDRSALRFMSRALQRHTGLRIGEAVPQIAVRWRAGAQHLEAAERSAEGDAHL
jgi:hypothetical protein